MPSSMWTTFWRKGRKLKRVLSAQNDGANRGGTEAARKCPPASLGCTVAVGHSHLIALVDAQKARIQQGQELTTHLHTILLQDEELQPNVILDGRRTTLSPALRRHLDNELAALTETPPFLCASIGGNEHFLVGLTEHPQPYDFSLSGRPDLAVRSGVQIIAPSLMRKTLERSMADTTLSLAIMTALREATDIPIVFLQSPPPVSSSDFIRNHPGPFQSAIEENGIAPASLRMKLWLLQSSIYRQHCEELGCRYLEVPAEAVDGSGFLQEIGSWQDSIHASPWYGELVLKQIDMALQPSQAAEVAR